jgi:uncharacterized Fe-S cluster protein YjdI/CDGSH-type Zn-finger protein
MSAEPPPDPRGKAYQAEGVTVYFNARRCIHSAECVRGLPDVFDTKQRPWIQPANAVAGQVAEIVRRCPTGALHYELHGGPAEAPEPTTRVSQVRDGPLLLRGDLRLELADGTLTETRAAMCRCGLTENVPFCDHACERAGWHSG